MYCTCPTQLRQFAQLGPTNLTCQFDDGLGALPTASVVPRHLKLAEEDDKGQTAAKAEHQEGALQHDQVEGFQNHGLCFSGRGSRDEELRWIF
jgi:hypothetical protein